MSQERQPCGAVAIYVRQLELRSKQRIETHRHRSHQLTFASSGAITMGVEDGIWVLPPSRALWIPAGTPHAVSVQGSTTMVATYFDPAPCPISWTEPTVVDASQVLSHLIEHLATELDPAPRRRAEAVIFDLLRPLSVARLNVPTPRDPRARAVAQALLANPADSRSLSDWGSHVGASGRTLSRIIERETGLGFDQWRTRVRVARALPALAGGMSVTHVAHEVGYASASAFVAAFKRTVGVSPGAYFSRL
jgi:AraC-like DNA-binding protein/quercetin dioxygenase-like cupin family protein